MKQNSLNPSQTHVWNTQMVDFIGFQFNNGLLSARINVKILFLSKWNLFSARELIMTLYFTVQRERCNSNYPPASAKIPPSLQSYIKRISIPPTPKPVHNVLKAQITWLKKRRKKMRREIGETTENQQTSSKQSNIFRKITQMQTSVFMH